MSKHPVGEISMTIIWHTGFPGGSEVKNLPAMYDTWVLSLGQEDPFKKEMATATVFLPGKSYGQSLAGYSPWGGTESDTTEVT